MYYMSVNMRILKTKQYALCIIKSNSSQDGKKTEIAKKRI